MKDIRRSAVHYAYYITEHKHFHYSFITDNYNITSLKDTDYSAYEEPRIAVLLML